MHHAPCTKRPGFLQQAAGSVQRAAYELYAYIHLLNATLETPLLPQRINRKRRQEVLLYNDCLMRNAGRVRWGRGGYGLRWVGLLDIDEIILPTPRGQVSKPSNPSSPGVLVWCGLDGLHAYNSTPISGGQLGQATREA